MTIPTFEEIIGHNDQTIARTEHLAKIRDLIGNAYPNKFERSQISGGEDTISQLAAFAESIKTKHIPTLPEGERPADDVREAANAELKNLGNVRASGRLAVPPRVMGKAAFVHLSDGVERLQIYVRKQDAKAVNNDTNSVIETENSGWDLFNLLNHGDFIGVEGYLFVTKTGELSIHVETIKFLSKALFPMPDKMHDIADPEIRRRFRYVDLIASSLRNKTDEELEEEKRTGVKKLTTREVFERRAKLITGMRRFLDDAGFIEVETPMLTPKATGAAAEPFETFHKALGIPLYARVAPELYLKRLMVGGFEKVYELNRNFRNEGLSQKHNPEFTMLEFYCAYMDVNGMMDFAEAMIKESVQKAIGSLQVQFDTFVKRFSSENDGTMLREVTRQYVTHEIDFKNFKRISMKKAISEYFFAEHSFISYEGKNYSENWLDDYELTDLIWKFSRKITMNPTISREHVIQETEENIKLASERAWKETLDEYKEEAENFKKHHTESNQAGLIVEIFEFIVEPKLIQPTFIIDYPKSISPLSKASPENPNIAERFELFINGMECANGFSELNDPQEQYERFADQMRERETGDAEAMVLDEDYIRALGYGMPPAAGIGIGIDRLVMLLTNRHSIRDVILFPHMRPEHKTHETEIE